MNIKQLKALFTKEIPTKDEMRNILSLIGEPDQLQTLLKKIIADDYYSSEVAAVSEIHRLGFDKLCLLSGDNYQLRLHIWWPFEFDINKEGIHNHKFNFCSHILKGSMINDLYQRCDENDTEAIIRHEYIANPVNTRQYDYFEYRGLSHIKMSESMILNSGTIYYMDNEEFHNGIPSRHDELTVTLFLRTCNIKSSDTIFEEAPFSNSKENMPLTVEMYRDRLTRFLSEL